MEYKKCSGFASIKVDTESHQGQRVPDSAFAASFETVPHAFVTRSVDVIFRTAARKGKSATQVGDFRHGTISVHSRH